jgi:ankyrin repeat protein
VAAKYGNIEVVRALLKHGANMDAEDEEGKTPLHKATGNVELVRMLLEHSADVNTRTKDSPTQLIMELKWKRRGRTDADQTWREC